MLRVRIPLKKVPTKNLKPWILKACNQSRWNLNKRLINNKMMILLKEINLRRLKILKQKTPMHFQHHQPIYPIAPLSSRMFKQSWPDTGSRLKHKLLHSLIDSDNQIPPQIDLRGQVVSPFLS